MPRSPELPKELDVPDRFGWFCWENDEAQQAALHKHRAGTEVSFGDAIIAYARSCGLNVVTEDLETYKGPRRTQHPVGVLRDWLSQVRWYIDRSSKTVVGRSFYSGRLTPADLFDRLIANANCVGLDLDDVTVLTRVRGGWRDHPGLTGLRLGTVDSPFHELLWAFYDRLSPANKALAKSEAGCPIGAHNARSLQRMFADWNKLMDEAMFGSPQLDQPDRALLVDPRVISTLRLRILANEYTHAPGNLVKRSYKMALEGTKDGRRFAVTIWGPDDLPFYSPQREQALIRAHEGSTKPR